MTEQCYKLIWRIERWFHKHWYLYLFRKADSPGWAYGSMIRDNLSRYWCRFKMHPEGEVFYNLTGLEPDERCKGCGDYI